jgi:hypothetical protein
MLASQGTKMNENNPKVALTDEQRETLAGTLDIFSEALRERRELRAADFRDIIGEVRHFQQSPAPCHPGLEYRLDCGRTVYVEGCYVSPSAVGYLAGSKDAIRADVIKRLPERVREQFPGIGGVYVKPVPEGELPPYTIMAALDCHQPVSDPAADFSSLVVGWLSDDIETSLPEMIEREIRAVEWDRCAMDGKY